MANLKTLKPSITELSEKDRIALVIASRKRRLGFSKKPNKMVNKKLISKLSQKQKQELLDLMETQK